MHSFACLPIGLLSGHKSSFQMNLFCSCSASHPHKLIRCQIPHWRWNGPPPPLSLHMARSEGKKQSPSVPPEPNLNQSTLGISQSLSIPQGHHWLCPVTQRCSRLAQLLSDPEGLESRSKAGNGLMNRKPLWKQIRTGSQTVTNKTIGGMPSLPVLPSFVSSAVPIVLLCLQEKGGNKISKLTPCWLKNKKYLHTWTRSDAKYSPGGFSLFSCLFFLFSFFSCNEFLWRIIKIVWFV